jgi:3-methyl-2-oxobutanoate hydroxymethyltransferase
VLQDALAVEGAGAAMTVIEAVPESLARRICAETNNLSIGIGASSVCDGQVLVLHDMLGVGAAKRPRFVKNFLDGEPGGRTIAQALARYVADVQQGRFPAEEHTYPDTQMA